MNFPTFVGIGEVLYDVFEDGTETMGGAPLNFAVHAHQLAMQLGLGQGIIVSCINQDPRGYKILDSLCRLGMSTRYLGKDSSHPTGLVSVLMRNGEPGYQIERESAWDYLADQPEHKELAAHCDAICFGSLAQRSPVSRTTIRSFLQNASQAIRLYDVNLRRNTLTGEAEYSREIIEYSCMKATIIKANRSELFAIHDLLGIACPAEENLDGIRRKMEALLSHFPARAVVVTRGAEGTILLNRDGVFDISVPVTREGKSYPVGAGDACAAGIVFGLTLGWDIPTTMDLANRMGSDVAAQPSATPPLSDSTLEFARAHLCSKASK
ncbi:MAG: putative fructokinase [Firmicutes bacterium]|nr:putative fructokinase [Bacillota bacterium]